MRRHTRDAGPTVLTNERRSMTEHPANPLAGDDDCALVLGEPDRAELVSVNRTELRLWCWGDATAPAVLLLHGAYDHGRMFDDLAPRVAALGYRTRSRSTFAGTATAGPSIRGSPGRCSTSTSRCSCATSSKVRSA